MNLLICGAGQYGKAAKELAEASGRYEKCLFLDDNSPLAIGKLTDVEKYPHLEIFVAIGNPALRMQIFEKIQKPPH